MGLRTTYFTAMATEIVAMLERVERYARFEDPAPDLKEHLRRERVEASREVIASMARRAPVSRPGPARIAGEDIRRFIPRRT